MIPSDPDYTLWLEMRHQALQKHISNTREDLFICCMLWLVWGFFLGMWVTQ